MFASQRRSQESYRLVHVTKMDLMAAATEGSGVTWYGHYPIAEGGHWFGVTKTDEVVSIIDAACGQRRLILNDSSWNSLVESDSMTTWFRLEMVPHDAPELTGPPYELYGTAMSASDDVMEIMTPLTSCGECGAPLARRDVIPARLYALDGIKDIKRISKRCCCKSCRVTHHYNYRSIETHKYHTLALEDMDFVFVNSKVGFTRGFLEYHGALQFRGTLSHNAIEFAQAETLWEDPDQHVRWHREYSAAQLYYTVLQEASKMWSAMPKHFALDKLKKIDIETPLNSAFLAAYSDWWHQTQLTKKEWQKVEEVVIDGHQKVAAKCLGSPPAHAGRPRADSAPKKRQNGWFMALDPSTGLVLAVANMKDPENNAIAKQVLLKVLDKGSCTKQFEREKAFGKIKYWCIDRFHAKGHAPGCPCSPLTHKRLDRRLSHVNSSIAEQTFSWFRNYAGILNTKAPDSHIFHVLVYVKRHNDLIRRNYNKHLNAYSAMKKIGRATRILRKPVSKKYVCRRPAGQGARSVCPVSRTSPKSSSAKSSYAKSVHRRPSSSPGTNTHQKKIVKKPHLKVKVMK